MAAIPKQKAYRDRYLLNMARRRTCLLKIPHVEKRSAENAIKEFSDWVTENAWRFESGDWQLEFVKEAA